LKAANDRGLVCDIIMGSGWPFGGEFLTREEQTQLMALQVRNVKGPQTLTLSRSELIAATDPPLASKYEDPYKELCALRLSPANLEHLHEVIDLDSEINKEHMTITVPEGDYVLY